MFGILSSNIKLMVYLAVISLGIAVYLHYIGVVKDRNAAIQRAKVLEQQIVLLEDANKQNLLTIENLISEKQLINDSLNNLEKSNSKDKQTISKLQKKLKDFQKDPKNQVELSPVLKDTLMQIENERKNRSKK